ncbi:hypothetical protein [Tatumella morbirosei]|nr:hypothetical protein [Tatumella morbirosei]
MSVLDLFIRRESSKTRLFVLIYIIIPLIILYFLMPFGEDFTLIAYQFKGDMIPLLVPVSLYFIIRNENEWYYFFRKFIYVILYTAIINSFFIYFESAFSNLFISTLGLSEYYNNRGGASGIRLDSTLWGLRAMGTTTSFGIAGTLTFLASLIIIELKPFSFRKNFIYFFFIVGAMVATTYKTTMIAFVFYMIYKVISMFLKNIKSKKVFY